MPEPENVNPLIEQHRDAVDERHRFAGVRFGLVEWDLAHLDPFAKRVEIEPGLTVDVVVLFSCHCFTHSIDADLRPQVPHWEIYKDSRESRVLDEERYVLSKKYLPRLVDELEARRIRVVSGRGNFFTLEGTTFGGEPIQYAVFFEVEKDARRKRRLLLAILRR